LVGWWVSVQECDFAEAVAVVRGRRQAGGKEERRRDQKAERVGGEKE